MTPESGYFYPNRIARVFLEALEELLGGNGLKALLNISGLPQYARELPPDDFQKAVDFADFAALNQGLIDIYGARSARGIFLRGGRAVFDRALEPVGALAGMRNAAFQEQPLVNRLRLGLAALARVFFQLSDQVCRVEEGENHFLFRVDRCPVCWGRASDHPACYFHLGLIAAALVSISGGQTFPVEEIACIAAGGSSCTFKIGKEPASE